MITSNIALSIERILVCFQTQMEWIYVWNNRFHCRFEMCIYYVYMYEDCEFFKWEMRTYINNNTCLILIEYEVVVGFVTVLVIIKSFYNELIK